MNNVESKKINALTNEQLEKIEIPTLRDQFAMAALTGLLSGYGYKQGEMVYMPEKSEVSMVAYDYADAMLEARKNKIRRVN